MRVNWCEMKGFGWVSFWVHTNAELREELALIHTNEHTNTFTENFSGGVVQYRNGWGVKIWT